MKIHTCSLHPYTIFLTNGQIRSGALIRIADEKGQIGLGDIAPLPKFSLETLEDAFTQMQQKQDAIVQIHWSMDTIWQQLEEFKLLPSVLFGLESALLALLDPINKHKVETSALLMGTTQQILEQAQLRKQEGFVSAKLKVSNLSFVDATALIKQLKDVFYLRIDVNRAWKTEESLQFFSQFPLDTFDYVEEPFQNPHDLNKFLHPLAVDESFPNDLSIEELESLPTLKALIYKPTIQGGLLGAKPLAKWATHKGIACVLSASFESDVGLAHVATLAKRLSLTAPVGIGTYHFLKDYLCKPRLQFEGSYISIALVSV